MEQFIFPKFLEMLQLASCVKGQRLMACCCRMLCCCFSHRSGTVILPFQHLAFHCFFFVTVWLNDSLETGLNGLAMCYYTNLEWGSGIPLCIFMGGHIQKLMHVHFRRLQAGSQLHLWPQSQLCQNKCLLYDMFCQYIQRRSQRKSFV